MALWGNDGSDANSAPKYNIEAGTDLTGITSFGKLTVEGARKVGTYPVDTTEATDSSMVVHPGWVVVREYTGPVSSLAIANSGTGYANADTITVSGGSVNATGTLVTNSTGGITSVALTSGGSGFTNTATVTITTSTGSNGSITATLGGRAGRKTSETLVAMSSITSANDSAFPS